MIATGRLTCSWKVTGANTMRLASSKMLDYYGNNLHNSTESLMCCVVPKPGNAFLNADQEGADAFIVAMECEKGKLRRLFDLGIKVHSYIALQLFTSKFKESFPETRYKGVDPDELAKFPECKTLLKSIKNSPDEYFLGKKTHHSFSYAQGLHTFRFTVLAESEGKIALTFAQAKEFQGTWSDTFKEVLAWQAETIARCKKDGILRNLFGFPRRFEHIWNDEKSRQALAFVPQSTVAIINNTAYDELWHRIRKERLPWFLRNAKHDSILLEVPDTIEHIDMGISYLKHHLGRELISSKGEQFRMRVGLSLAKGNWGHWHEKDNPTGLKEL